MSERVWRAIAYETMRGPMCDAVLRFAVVLWWRDPASGLTDVQGHWLRTRLADATPFTAEEHRKLVPKLLVWSRGKGCEAALVQGLRGVVGAGLLPAEEKSR